MNSLTTVNNKVVDAEGRDVIEQTDARRRPNVARRIRSVDGPRDRPGNDGDSIDGPFRPGTSPKNLLPAALNRQRSVPENRTAATARSRSRSRFRSRLSENHSDGLELRPPRPRSSDSTATSIRNRGGRRLSSPRGCSPSTTCICTTPAPATVSEPREPTESTPTTTEVAGIVRHVSVSNSLSNDDSSGAFPRAVTSETLPRPAAPPSPAAALPALSPTALARKQSILTTLHAVSRSESYVASPYFQRIFSQGVANVERYDRELMHVEEALRTCFDINEDILGVISNSILERERHSGRHLGSDNVARDLGGQTAEPTTDASRASAGVPPPGAAAKPWEAPTTTQPWEAPRTSGRATSTTPHCPPLRRPWSEPRKRTRSVVFSELFSPPANLSKYTSKASTVARSPSDDGSVALTHPPQNQGAKYPRTPEKNDATRAFGSIPSLPATPGKLQYQTPDAMTASASPYHRTASAPTALTSEEAQREQEAMHRKEKARQRVQQYLTQIDDRIRYDKCQGGNVNHGSVAQQRHGRDPLTGNDGASRSVGVGMGTSPAALTRGPVDKHAGGVERLHTLHPRLFLPSLETPGGGGEQELQPPREQQQHLQRQPSQQTLGPSVSFVQAAPAENPAADSTRQMAKMVGSSFPPTKSNINSSDVNREVTGLHSHHSNGDHSSVFTPSNSYLLVPRNNSTNSAKEEQIKTLEKSLGLKSIEDFKNLLKQKMSELQHLEQTFQTQMEQNDHEMEAQYHEICQFKVALSEAERAIKALEDTIHHLEEASDEKDELIQQLQTRVETLELELARSTNFGQQKETEYEEHIRRLNQNISQMSVTIKEKDGALSFWRIKTREIEAELATTLAAMSDAQKTIARQEKQLQTSEHELASTKELLSGQTNIYKDEISSSLENTTQLMDLVAKEKDNLIDSLNAKICILEQSLKEVEMEVDQGLLLGKKKEQESREKSRALREKDLHIAVLQKETNSLKKRKETETFNKKTQMASHKTQHAKTQTPERGEGKQFVGMREVLGDTYEDDDSAKPAYKASSRRPRSRSSQPNREKEHESERHYESRHQSRYRSQYQRVKKDPPATRAPRYTHLQQKMIASQGERIYRDDARDDEVGYHGEAMVDDSGRQGQLVAYYTSNFSDGDSVFDFSS